MSTQCKRGFTRRGLLQRAEPPFRLSVMLWTVFQKLPIERRLERIAEAGYRSVELVTEFTEWSDKDFRRINAKPRALGMVFDTMAGNGGYTLESVGLTDPSEREGFLTDIRHALGIARKLECSSMIAFSGSVVEGTPHKTQHESIVEGLKRGMWLTSRASFAAREHRSRRRSSLVFVECGRGA